MGRSKNINAILFLIPIQEPTFKQLCQLRSALERYNSARKLRRMRRELESSTM